MRFWFWLKMILNWVMCGVKKPAPLAPLLDAGAEVDARVRRLWETPDGKIVPIVVATIRRGDADPSIAVERATARRSANDTTSRYPATKPGAGCASVVCVAIVLAALAVIAAL
jgi:hypothetical protein